MHGHRACSASRPAATATITSARCCSKRNDFIIVDFEGEPGRTLAERRAQALAADRRCRHAALLRLCASCRARARCAAGEAKIRPTGRRCCETWEQEARRTFIASYDEVARASGLYESLQESRPLLTLFEIDKALYEVRYELGNRPDWTRIPLRACFALSRMSTLEAPWTSHQPADALPPSPRQAQRIGAVWPGQPYPRGATWDGEGVNFSLFSANADKVELCIFDPSGQARGAADRAARAHG